MTSYFGSRFSPKGIPLLLWLGMYWSAFTGGYLIMALLLLPFDILLPGFAINDVPVTSRQFFAHPAGMLFIPFALSLLAVAYALFTRRHWSRVLMLAIAASLWIVILIAAALAQVDWTDALLAILLPLGVWWYLYASRGPVQYYRVLAQSTDSAGAGA